MTRYLDGRAQGGPVRDPEITLGYASTARGFVHYATAGTGQPMLLLHQTPRSWDEYRELLPQLGRRVRAVAMDTPGMGASEPLADGASIEGYADTALALGDALGFDRFHLMGHHTGSVIALEIAARAPERVDRLVLSSCPWVDARARARRRTRRGIDDVEPQPGGEHLTDLWQRRQAHYPPDRPDLLHRFVRDAMSVDDPEAGHRAVSEYAMEDRIGRVRAPTLCIGHEDDPFAFPDLADVASRIAGAQVAVVSGGMVPLEHRADAVAALVLEFLGAGDSGSA